MLGLSIFRQGSNFWNGEALLPKTIEARIPRGRRCIKRTHDRFDRLQAILHVVGEYQHLRDIDELPKLLVSEAGIDPVTLRKDPVAVVGLFHLHKCKRHVVDEQSDVGPELVVAVAIGQFRDHMKRIVLEILEIDQLDPRLGGQHFIKSLPQNPQFSISELR